MPRLMSEVGAGAAVPLMLEVEAEEAVPLMSEVVAEAVARLMLEVAEELLVATKHCSLEATEAAAAACWLLEAEVVDY